LLQAPAVVMAIAGIQQLYDIALRCGNRPQSSRASFHRHEVVMNRIDEVQP
jgi:hypothetical protein